MFELASVTQIMDDLKDYPYLICPDFVILFSGSISKRGWLQKMIMNSQITQLHGNATFMIFLQ
jgi:hypothetical protein